MYFRLDDALLDAARAACVALPVAGVPPVLRRLRSRGWAIVAPASILGAAGALAAWSAGAQVFAWVALLLVPPGCVLALGWAAHGARTWLTPLAVPLLLAALAWPAAPVGQVARIVLIAGAAVTSGRLLAGAAPISLLKVGVVAMAAIDATFIFGHLSDTQNAQFAAAAAAPGLPQLQVANLGGASCDFADFFAAALVGAIFAREGRDQLLAAAAAFVVTLAFDQLFLVVDTLPATVPPAVVMLLLHDRRAAAMPRLDVLRRRRRAQPQPNSAVTKANAPMQRLFCMNRRKLMIPGAAAGVAVAALLLGGVTAAAPTQPTTARAAATSLTAPYAARYASESAGLVAHATLSRLARDPGLLAAVRSGSSARVRRYVHSRFRSVWYHWHVSRMRVTRGHTTVIETGVPFVVDGPSTTLRDARGHALARLQISIQDVIGFVRLNARLDHVDTVVRGRGSADVRTSLPAALNVKLPRRGEVTIAGHRYQVGSFHETGWRDEPLTIWILH